MTTTEQTFRDACRHVNSLPSWPSTIQAHPIETDTALAKDTRRQIRKFISRHNELAALGAFRTVQPLAGNGSQLRPVERLTARTGIHTAATIKRAPEALQQAAADS